MSLACYVTAVTLQPGAELPATGQKLYFSSWY